MKRGGGGINSNKERRGTPDEDEEVNDDEDSGNISDKEEELFETVAARSGGLEEKGERSGVRDKCGIRAGDD